MRIAIIGAGASGIIAALTAAKKNFVYLFDGNDKCGKKILVTGAGHCNYWNSDINISRYQTDNFEKLQKVISEEHQKEVLGYLDSLGIYPKVKNGYYYPYSNQATSIRQIFENELIHNTNIKVLNNNKVMDITKKDMGFIIKSEQQEVYVDKVILATGSRAYPRTGSDGSGYNLAKRLGHYINPVLPALTKLITDDVSIKEWENIRCDALVKLYINNKFCQEETGELQLTKDGISGICTFNISSLAAKNLYLQNDVMVKINFLPHLMGKSYEFLMERSKKMENKTIEEVLESIFNYKLLFILLKKANILRNVTWKMLSEKEKQRLVNVLENFQLKIVATETFDKSQVCTGGVPLSEINETTMESLIVPNVYFAGEIIDVDGQCGGYNLAFAFITGYLSGSGLND